MQADEHAYYITDGSLADLVATLTRTSPPLIEVADDAGDAGAWLRGTVSLTDAGREVLAGRRDRVACGLDRWLGGVHLRNGGAVWRWDGERLHLTSK